MPPRATWWTQLSEGVNYWRAELPARHLPGHCVSLNPFSGDIQPAEGKALRSGEPAHMFPRQHGAAIWMFPGNTTRAILMAEMRNQGIPVLVEVDDNYRTPPPLAEFSMWQRRITDGDAHSYEEHSWIVSRVAQAVICSTPHLAREYADLHPVRAVCPNSVDPQDWDEDPPHRPDGVLRVGWAASDSHIYDAGLIRRALSWAADQDGVEVVIIGIDPSVASWPFPHRHIPFAPMAEYRRNLREIDVMLCPLKPSRWADCKSDVKALEAAMSGACSVVSEAEPYRPWFNRTYTARDAKGFLRAVKEIVRDPKGTLNLAREARDYVLKERTIQGNVWRWQEAIDATRRRMAA